MSRLPESHPLPCSQGVTISKARELAVEGWEQRTVSDPRRVADIEEGYADLGLETLTTGLDPSTVGAACTSCAVSACGTYVALFTRKTPSN